MTDGRRPEEDPSDAVRRRAERKLAARGKRHRAVWHGLSMFGLVGWAVALPTLAGVALGLWIDSQSEGGRSWTLALLLAGAALGCLNAWYWVKRESSDDR